MRRWVALARTITGVAPVLALSLALGLLAGLGTGAPGANQPVVMAQATPQPGGDTTLSTSITAMLARLPAAPLDQTGMTVSYANVAAQTAALGLSTPPNSEDEAARATWAETAIRMALPQTTAQHWTSLEWREAFGFDLFQVAAAAEFSAPPLGVTVVRGNFDPNELRAAWARGGYQPLDFGPGEAYAVREDFALDLADAGGRLAMSYLNVIAIAEDGSLVFGSTRAGVRAALATAAGQEPSFADTPPVAALLRATPPDLVSALVLGGEVLRATPDPAGALLGEESPQVFATRVAAELEEAQRLPMILAALLGQTAGVSATGDDATPGASAVPISRVVVSLTTPSPETAQDAAEIIAERLATHELPETAGSTLAGRPWADLFPTQNVQAIPGEPAALIELTSTPGVPPLILQNLLFQRIPGFLAWGP
jgi:hypothetical protein